MIPEIQALQDFERRVNDERAALQAAADAALETRVATLGGPPDGWTAERNTAGQWCAYYADDDSQGQVTYDGAKMLAVSGRYEDDQDSVPVDVVVFVLRANGVISLPNT
jgi:hypothetical protein